MTDQTEPAKGDESPTVQLTAVWVKGSLERSEQDLHLGRERLGSVWKASIGDGWLYAMRSDRDSREAPTRDTAKAALVALLNQSFERETVNTDYILLKWGTLKGWKVDSEKSRELLRDYVAIGHSISCIDQQDTPEQKEIICALIRQHEGSITNDWDGKKYTKEQAISYIMNYGTRDD